LGSQFVPITSSSDRERLIGSGACEEKIGPPWGTLCDVGGRDAELGGVTPACASEYMAGIAGGFATDGGRGGGGGVGVAGFASGGEIRDVKPVPPVSAILGCGAAGLSTPDAAAGLGAVRGA